MLKKQKTKKIKLNLIGIITLVIILNFSIFIFNSIAAPDPEITYHGKLTDTNSVAVADGNYDFTISIYDAETGGNCIWTARGNCTTPTAKTLSIQNGIFNTTLGEAGDNTLSTLDFNSNYYLEIKIGTNSPMTPRRKVTPTGFALNSYRLNGLTADNYIDTSATDQLKQGGLDIGGNFSVNTSDFYVDTVSGRVGIATTSVSEALTVNGAINIGNTTEINPGTIRYNGTDFEGYNGTLWNSFTKSTFLSLTDTPNTYTNGSILFTSTTGVTQDNTNLFWDDTNNRLGVGTNTPLGKMNIHSSGTDTILYITGDTTKQQALNLGTNAIDRWSIISDTNNALLFYSDHTGDGGSTAGSRILISEIGDVGIGTTTPNEKLQVSGAINVGNTTNTNLGTIRWTGTDFQGYMGSAWASLTGGAGSYNAIWDADANTGIQVEETTNDDTIRFNTAGVERLQITSAGHVIPTVNIAYDLGSTTNRFRDLYLSSNTLHIGSTLTDEGTIAYDTTNNILNITTDATTNGDIAFNTDDLYIDKSTGFVGIGITTPGAMLDVAGTISGLNRFDVNYPTTGVYDDATSDSPYSRVNADSFHTNGLGVSQLYLEGNAIDGNAIIKIGAGLAGGMSTRDVVLGNNNELYMDTSANRVGIGTGVPNSRFNVEGGRTYLNYSSNTLYTLQVMNGGSEGKGVRIQSGGSTTASYPLFVERYDGTNLFYIRGDGNYYHLGSAISTKESKRDVENFTESGLNLLNDIEIVTYNYIMDDKDRVRRIGFIANDVEHVYDDRLTNNKTGFDVNSIVGTIIKATQEQNQLITTNQNNITLSATATSLNQLQKLTEQQFTDTNDILEQAQGDILTLQEDANKLATKTIPEIESNIEDLQDSLSSLSILDTIDTRVLALNVDKLMFINSDSILQQSRMIEDGDGNMVEEKSDIATLTLAGILNVKKLVADEIETNKLVMDSNNIVGSAIICQIEQIYDTDNEECVQNKEGDGQSIFIKTKSITKDSHIFITPRGDIDQILSITNVTSGEGFTVKSKEIVENVVIFDWLIVDGS